MAITPLPTAPSRYDPANFTVRAEAFFAALATMVSELNGQAASTVVGNATISGNLGIGTVPSSWGGTSKGVDIGSWGAVGQDGSDGSAVVVANAYDSGGGAYKYKLGFLKAALLKVNPNGSMLFNVAGAATAGASVVWVQAMVLDAGASLILQGVSGPTTHNVRLVSANTSTQMRFVWNNAGTFAGIGSDASGATIFGRCSSLDGTGATAQISLDVNGNLLSVAGGGVGYGAGSGGTVTQTTSKSTGITLNKPSGRIIMSNAALAAGTTVAFVLSNSLIGADDAPFVVIRGGQAAGAGTYNAWVDSVSVGSCVICLRNTSASSLSESINLTFTLIKGASA